MLALIKLRHHFNFVRSWFLQSTNARVYWIARVTCGRINFCWIDALWIQIAHSPSSLWHVSTTSGWPFTRNLARICQRQPVPCLILSSQTKVTLSAVSRLTCPTLTILPIQFTIRGKNYTKFISSFLTGLNFLCSSTCGSLTWFTYAVVN